MAEPVHKVVIESLDEGVIENLKRLQACFQHQIDFVNKKNTLCDTDCGPEKCFYWVDDPSFLYALMHKSKIRYEEVSGG